MKKIIAVLTLLLFHASAAQAVSSSARYVSAGTARKHNENATALKTQDSTEKGTRISYTGTSMDFSKFLHGVNIGTNALLNVFLRSEKCLGVVNDAIKRYGSVSDLQHDEKGFHAVAHLHGAEQPVSIHLKRIEIAADGSNITFTGFSSDTLWANNLLEDLAEGRQMKIPKKHRSIVASLAKILNRVQPRLSKRRSA